LACNGTETCNTTTGCTNPADVNCGDHGVCVETPVPGECDCDIGYTGTACGECDTAGGYIPSNATPGDCVDDPCDPEACNDHGTCSVSPTDEAVCACEDGHTGDHCETALPPEISGLGIDCSSTGGYCTTLETYPVSWNFEYATSFDTSLELISGSTTLGTLAPASGALTGTSKTINYTLGNSGPATVRLNVTTHGPGGDTSQYIDIVYY